MTRAGQGLLVVVAVVLIPGWSRGATKEARTAEAVGLFEAIAAGDIAVQLFAKDAIAGTLIVANKAGRPLTIRLPEAFAGVPVAAQVGFNPFGVQPGNNGPNGNQTVGLAPQNPWGNNGPGAGPGFFNVGPERAIKVKLVAVCLEHGKPEPNSRLPYEIRPLESFTSDAGVHELVKMLGRGEIDQPAAQAAVWHLTDGLSWQNLGQKIGVKHLIGPSEPYFTAKQIERAKRAVEKVQSGATDNDRQGSLAAARRNSP
jgi:hypothetical protein